MFTPQNNGFHVGPPTPYQKPIMMIGWLAFIFLALAIVFWFIFTSDKVSDHFRHKHVQQDEIELRNIDTSTTTNDRLLAVYEGVRELDQCGREQFGDFHYWHDPDSEPAPKQINLFNHKLNDLGNRFLRTYNDVAAFRLKASKKLEQLEHQVDGSVSGESTVTSANEFQMIRTLNNDVRDLIDELKRNTSILEELGSQYQQGGGKPW